MNMIQETRKQISRRDRRRAEKSAAILDAAQARVVRDGVDGLTMPGLAADLDIAVGSLYRYFAGKEALVAGLQVRAIVGFAAHLEARLGARRGVAAVRSAWSAWREYAVAQPELHGLIDAMLSDPRRLLDPLRGGAARQQRQQRRRGQRALRPTHERARVATPLHETCTHHAPL